VSSRAARQPLTRTRILESALALVDREGPDALTMRRLGDELGVAAMSLYHHLRGREELLDGLSEIMVGQIDLGDTGTPPRVVLTRFVHGIRAVALAHPAAFGLVGMRPLRSVEALRPIEATLAALRTLGLDAEHAAHAYRALASYARGFALAESSGFTLENEPLPHLPADTPTNLAELHHQLALTDHDTAFAYGADALLAGILATAATR
jgi:AcrR family transcriptional regulator